MVSPVLVKMATPGTHVMKVNTSIRTDFPRALDEWFYIFLTMKKYMKYEINRYELQLSMVILCRKSHVHVKRSHAYGKIYLV